MKTIIAALAFAVIAAAPAIASDGRDATRDDAKAAAEHSVATEATTSSPVALAPAVKKVRVVLASPYGN